MKQSRAIGFIVIAAIYVAAAFVGVFVFRALPDSQIFVRVLAGDAIATVFVYLAGVLLKNASVYDPYWSLAPIAILTGVAIFLGSSGKTEPGVILLLLAVWYWGIRLTANWAHTFKNLATQDWRYDGFKSKYPRVFQLVSFFGINMFPTMVVYLCVLPGIAFIGNSACNALTAAGFALCLMAATLQLVADVQMHRFRRENAGKRQIIRDGLWKHSRHPNYLGEILMWWGVYVMMISSGWGMWYLGAGALVNTLMFLFVSIPLADRRNREERPGYDGYAAETNRLLPFKLNLPRLKS